MGYQHLYIYSQIPYSTLIIQQVGDLPSGSYVTLPEVDEAEVKLWYSTSFSMFFLILESASTIHF